MKKMVLKQTTKGKKNSGRNFAMFFEIKFETNQYFDTQKFDGNLFSYFVT